MKKFKYKARSKEGKLVSGLVEAVNKKQAVAVLREKGLVVVQINAVGGMLSDAGDLIQRVGTKQLADFTRQLSTMITAGLNLVDALIVLENQYSGRMKQVVGELRRGVESGQSLSKSMADQGKVFDQVYVALIKAGEAGGLLDKVLARLADNLEKRREFQSKVKGAMIYPAVIFLGMIGVMLIMIVYIIPQLAGIYKDFEAELPLTTVLLLNFSDLFGRFWWITVLLLIGIGLFVRSMLKNKSTRPKIEAAVMSLPIFGELWEQIMITNFALTLAVLTEAGVPIVQGLHLSSKVTSSQLYQAAIRESAKLVEKGLPMAQAFAQQQVFPPLLLQMLSVGEETGQVGDLLERVSNYYKIESEQKVKNLTTLIEPLILIILAVGVGFLVFAVVMPIYNLTTAL
jgi:type IV pilus assembly protein PilC